MKPTSIVILSLTFFVIQTLGLVAAPSKTFSAFKLLQDGFYEEAIIEYETFRSRYPDEADIHFNLGISYFKTQRYSSAQRSFERALQLKIEDPAFQSNAEYNIGNALFEQSKLFLAETPERALIYLEEAIATFENAVSLQPNFNAAKYNLSVAKMLLEEIKNDSDDSNSPGSEEQEPSDSENPSEESPQESKENDSSEQNQQQAPQAANNASEKKPTRKEEMGSNNLAGDMSLEEAMMLLDAAELDDKRISLSQIQEKEEKDHSIINLNW